VDLASLLNALEVGLHELLEAWVRSPLLLHEGDSVAETETVLEEEGRAEALECALAHDTDTVAEHVSLIHIMRGQNDDAILLV